MYYIPEQTKRELLNYIAQYWVEGVSILETLLTNYEHYLNNKKPNSSPFDFSPLETQIIPILLSRVVMLLQPVSKIIGIQPGSSVIGADAYTVVFIQLEKMLTSNHISISAVGEKIKIADLKTTVYPITEFDYQHFLEENEETIQVIAQQLIHEIVNNILSKIVNYNIKEEILSPDFLMLRINEQANKIALITRRGPANFAVMSAKTLEYLKLGKLISFKENTEKDVVDLLSLQCVGKINFTITVFISNLISDDAILIGYKGHSMTDVGAVYSPMNLIVVNEDFLKDNKTNSLSREDTIVFNDSKIVSGSDYYRTIKYSEK